MWLGFRERRAVWTALGTAGQSEIQIPLVSLWAFIFQLRALSLSAITRHSTTTSTGLGVLPGRRTWSR